METDNISALIQDLRETTLANSVSPETVGSILQKITDVLAEAADKNDVSGYNKVTIDLIRQYKIRDFICRNVSLTVRDDKLVMLGHSALRKAGYVPYLFRLTRKRNKYTKSVKASQLEEKGIDPMTVSPRPPRPVYKKHSKSKKGWNLMGGQHMVEIAKDGIVRFSTNEGIYMIAEALGYSDEAASIAPKFYLSEVQNQRRIPWGRTCIKADDKNGKPRMLVFHFAIAWGMPYKPGPMCITPTSMVTPLVRFALRYEPHDDRWTFTIPQP